MLFPWFLPAIFLCEVNQVIALRTSKLAFGGEDAEREFELMCCEKADAYHEIFAGLLRGETWITVSERLCEHVAKNVRRLKSE